MAAKVSITLGLISFEAGLEIAKQPATTAMVNLCVGSNGKPAHDPKPLTAPRCCTECGEIVDYTVIKKGIKQGTSYAVTTQEEVLEAVIQNTAPYKGKVNLVAHPVADFEGGTAPGKALYYIVPAAGAEDRYQAVLRLIGSHPELAFASLYTPKSVAALYCVKVRDGVLVLEERTRGQALKAAPVIGGTVDEAFFAMADMMLSLPTSVQPYDPDAYEDTYATAINLLAVQAQDIIHVGATAAAPTAAPESNADLMAKMQALIDAAKVAA